MIYRENIEWLDIWVPAASECVRPRVLLVGDSITRSYYPYVQERLAGRYACARIASSKCVADPMYLRELELILDEYEFACIHFNNGLHGWGYYEPTYAAALKETFDRLVAYCGASHLIWASTTPVWTEGDEKTLATKTERVRERNRIAAELAASCSVLVNDLFSHVVEQPDLFSEDGVHFVEAGQITLGRQVADAILARMDNR